MPTRRSVLAASLAVPALMFPQASAEVRARALASDLAILRRAYEMLHPGLYRYNTPRQMNRHFDRLQRAWSKDQSLSAAYLSLSVFLAKVRCGHTYANFYNQSDAVVYDVFAGNGRLPFHFRWLGEKMIVTDPKGTDGLAPGDEIVRINGVRGDSIQKSMLRLARADGGNDAKRAAQMGISGSDRFEAFDIFFPLRYPEAGVFDLEVQPLGKSVRTRVAAAGITLAARRAQAPAGQDGDPVFTLAFPQAGAALLTMPNWALYDNDWDWKAFIANAFQQITERGSRTLIIDIRGNEGGLDCGDEVIARLIGADLPRAAYERRVRYISTPKDLDPYLDTWDNSFRDWGKDAVPLDDRFFRLNEEGGETRAPIRPQGPRFSGKVIVLTDANNSSATFQFANQMKANGLATLVGAPTGGNLRGINGGAFFFLRLPESGLECDLPLIGTFPVTKQPDGGVLPDVRVIGTAADIALSRDPAMAAAMALAAKA